MALRFGPFTLDLQTRQLTRETGEIHLSPKAFELLGGARPSSGRECSPRASCNRRLWPDTFVAEANLSNLDRARFATHSATRARIPAIRADRARLRLRLLRQRR